MGSQSFSPLTVISAIQQLLNSLLLTFLSSVGLYSPPPLGPVGGPRPAPPMLPPIIPTPPSGRVRPTGPFRPAPASIEVDEAIRDAVYRYNLPRWHYYATIARESYFDPNAIGPVGDVGLTQLYGPWHAGMPYPENLSAPDDTNQQWGWDNGFNMEQFGHWISMEQVSPMTMPFDPKQNLDRYSTVVATPQFYLWKRVHGFDDNETLRAVAFHYRYGIFLSYDPNDSYLTGSYGYDYWRDQFKPIVEMEDGVWDGRPNV